MNKKKRLKQRYIVLLVIIGILICFSSLVLFRQKYPVQLSEGNLVTIEDESISLTVDTNKMGAIVSIKDKKSGREFIKQDKTTWFKLYQIHFKDEIHTTKKNLVDNLDSSCFEYQKEDNNEYAQITMTTCHNEISMDVTSIIKLNKTDNSLNFNINIKNSGDKIIQSVSYPLIPLNPVLGESSEDDYFVYPSTTGELYKNIGSWPTVEYTRTHPSAWGYMQFMAFYDKSELPGLYIQSEDINGNYKRINFIRYNQSNNDILVVKYNNFISENYGNDFALDYNIKLKTFYGDWYDSADIYKKWALKQWWAEKTIWERDDIPKFLFESTLLQNGKLAESDKDYSNLLPVNEQMINNRYLSSPYQIDYKNIIYTNGGTFGREIDVGEWSAMNYFYPYKGTKNPFNPVDGDKLYEAVNSLNEINISMYAWISANRWDLWEFDENGNLLFNDSTDFYNSGANNSVIVKENGLEDYRVNSFSPSGHERYSAMIDIGSNGEHNAINLVIRDNIIRGMRRGISLMNLDQINGGWIWGDADYNLKYINSRGIGYGRWMHNRFVSLLQDINQVIDEEGKQGKFGIGLEGTSEYYIPYLQIVHTRQAADYNTYTKIEDSSVSNIPLFSYIYSKNYIGADAYASFLEENQDYTSKNLWGISSSVLQGGIPIVATWENPPRTLKDTENLGLVFFRKLVANINQSYRGAEMLNPPEINGIPEEISEDYENNAGTNISFFFEPVLTRVFLKHDGVLSYIFVNIDNRTESLSLSFKLDKYKLENKYFDVYKKYCGSSECVTEKIFEDVALEKLSDIEFNIGFTDLVIFDVVPKEIPASTFSPVLAYYPVTALGPNTKKLALWSSDGKYVIWDGVAQTFSSVKTNEQIGLPADFNPVLAYYPVTALGPNTKKLTLWSSDGKYVIWDGVAQTFSETNIIQV